MIMTEEFEENRFLKSYLDIGMNKVQVGYNTLEHYSPAMASFVDVTFLVVLPKHHISKCHKIGSEHIFSSGFLPGIINVLCL